MRGEWNGLQALIANECPFAYYIHCFDHRLQLALVGSSKEVIHVYQFFSKLTLIVNAVGASCKRSDELRLARAIHVANMIDAIELETTTGLNQIRSLQRPGDTRWSSHLSSISSLIFSETSTVLNKIIDEGTTHSLREDAYSAHEALTSFDFIFILHLMKEVLEITDTLCQALQQKSILNAMDLVENTKILLQSLRDNGRGSLLSHVRLFCETHNVEVPNMDDPYTTRRGRPRHQQDQSTIKHLYRVDIFLAIVDSQLQELNNRFNENEVELLTLSCSLDPRDEWKSCTAGNISILWRNIIQKTSPHMRKKLRN